ncbi:hypothetical protein CB1_001508017 [Camelus ferus]|nr:hypothetical protein CB1_001508017 [Camelus ferus]
MAPSTGREAVMAGKRAPTEITGRKAQDRLHLACLYDILNGLGKKQHKRKTAAHQAQFLLPVHFLSCTPPAPVKPAPKTGLNLEMDGLHDKKSFQTGKWLECCLVRALVRGCTRRQHIRVAR